MALYVLATDPGAIDFGHAALRSRVEAYLRQTPFLYRPLSFVEHSGFSETVREEIALVLTNHAPQEPPIRKFDEFVAAWELERHLDRRVLDLSGGWRKYLGLALFMNRPLTCRLMLDTTSHLSDARVRTLLHRAAETGDTVFCEYDSQLLLSLTPDTERLPSLNRLNDDGAVVTGTPPR